MRHGRRIVRIVAASMLLLGPVGRAGARSADIASGVANNFSNNAALFAPRTGQRSVTEADAIHQIAVGGEKATQSGQDAVLNADTDLAANELVKDDIRSYDVARFKLGMSAREVARIAAAAGMRTGNGRGMVPFDPALHGSQVPSFRTRVATDAAARQHRPLPRRVTVVGEVTLVAANGDKAIVHFFTTEDGPRVSSVTFITSFFGATPKGFLEALTVKYGRPMRSSISGDLLAASWCATSDPQCGDRPSLKMSSGQTEVSITLDAGFLALQDLDRRVDAAAAVMAAATAIKPTF